MLLPRSPLPLEDQPVQRQVHESVPVPPQLSPRPPSAGTSGPAHHPETRQLPPPSRPAVQAPCPASASQDPQRPRGSTGSSCTWDKGPPSSISSFPVVPPQTSPPHSPHLLPETQPCLLKPLTRQPLPVCFPPQELHPHCPSPHHVSCLSWCQLQPKKTSWRRHFQCQPRRMKRVITLWAQVPLSCGAGMQWPVGMWLDHPPPWTETPGAQAGEGTVRGQMRAQGWRRGGAAHHPPLSQSQTHLRRTWDPQSSPTACPPAGLGVLASGPISMWPYVEFVLSTPLRTSSVYRRKPPNTGPRSSLCDPRQVTELLWACLLSWKMVRRAALRCGMKRRGCMEVGWPAVRNTVALGHVA